MMSGAPLPSSVLLLLTAAVLAAHVWVLQPPPRRVPAAAVVRAPAFATRRVQAPVAPAAPSQQASPARATPGVRAKAMQGELAATAREPQAARPREAASRPASVPPPDAVRVVVPPPAQLRYEVTAQVKQQRVQGSSALSWQHDGRHYTASFEVDVPGLPARRQTSDGQVTAAGFAPLRFGEQSRGEQAAHFERDAGRVSFSNNRPAAPLLAGAQDRLSVVLQLAALLAGDPQHARPGATIAIQTATTREAQAWLFTVEGEETLLLGGVGMTTVKLLRAPRADYDQRIELWLAPGKAYAPVRLRLTQPNGDWADHQWSATDRP